MKNPTTIEEIINQPKEYRTKGRDIGICSEIDYKFGRIKLSFGEDGDDWFKLSQVQELTPLSYKGKRIAIGDWVKFGGVWYEVRGYHFKANIYVLELCKDGVFGAYGEIEAINIQGHKTTKHDEEVEKAIKLLTDKGIIIDGKVIL